MTYLVSIVRSLPSQKDQSSSQQNLPETGDGDDDQSGEDLDGGDDGHDDEPEPQEDVDLLIDDVERKHAEAVKLLNCSRRTEFVKRALRHLNTNISQSLTQNYLVVTLTFGKTFDMGSSLSSCSSTVMAITSLPYVVNSPPRKRSIR